MVVLDALYWVSKAAQTVLCLAVIIYFVRRWKE